MRLILGSASARRRALLAQIGIVIDEIRVPDIDETARPGELPQAYVARIVDEKRAALMPLGDDELVLCADSIVACGRRILGKPQNRDEAENFLHLLSARRHHVITCVELSGKGKRWRKTVKTTVKFAPLTKAMRETYLESNEWQDKAGGYAIQGRAAAFVVWLSGSYSNVVGLPLRETALILEAGGIKPAPPPYNTEQQ